MTSIASNLFYLLLLTWEQLTHTRLNLTKYGYMLKKKMIMVVLELKQRFIEIDLPSSLNIVCQLKIKLFCLGVVG